MAKCDRGQCLRSYVYKNVGNTSGCIVGVLQALYSEVWKHHAWMNKSSIGLQKASALRQHVGQEGHQLNDSGHEMHASMHDTIKQLSADLAQALTRNADLEAQVATLTAALGQPSRPYNEAVPSGPAPDTDPAQQAEARSLSTAAQSGVLVNGGHSTVALQLDLPTPSKRLAQSKSFITSLPGSSSLPVHTFSIAAFPPSAGGSPSSLSSSSSMGLASSIPASISTASHVPSRLKAILGVLPEGPLSSAVNIPSEVVQPQAPAHPSSSPAAAPGDVPAAGSRVNIAPAAESPAAAQPSASSTEGKATRGGAHHTAAPPPVISSCPASAQTVPGCKGAQSSSGSAKPGAKGLLRRFLSPGAALAAIFAAPKKVAGSLKTGLQGIVYSVAKKTLPSALFTHLSIVGRGRQFLSPGAALAAVLAAPKTVSGSLKTGLQGIAWGVAKKTLPGPLFIQLKLLMARPARKALAAEAQTMSRTDRRLHKRAWRKLREARVAQMDAERAIQLLDEGIRLKAPGDVVNCLLYSDRAWWQWKRKCGAHALLDAITAQQFNCPEAGMGWPVFLCGFAWELMGIYSSAVEDFSLAQQKGFFLQPGGLKRLKALEDCVNHQHVLGFTPGGIETVNSLSRRLLARLHPDKASSQRVPEAVRQRLYHMVQEAKHALLTGVRLMRDVPTGPHLTTGSFVLCGVLLWCLISVVMPGLCLWLFYV